MLALKLLPSLIGLGVYIANNYDASDIAKALSAVGLMRRPAILARLIGPMGWIGVGVAVGGGVALVLSPELRTRLSQRLRASNASNNSAGNGAGNEVEREAETQV